MSPSSALAPAPAGLATRQALTSLAIGIGFWFAAAKFAGLVGPLGFFSPPHNATTLFLTVITAWPSVKLIQLMVQLSPSQLVPSIGIGTAVAAILDGTALTWTPTLYGNQTPQILGAAAWILWGAGWILAAAYLEALRSTSRNEKK